MAKKKPLGHSLLHATDKNACRLVPLMWLPIETPPGQPVKICPTCRVHHPVKTMHIWIGPNGEALVSQGVLDLLQRAGMDGFALAGSTTTPPALRIGDGKTREQMDNSNRAQIIYQMPTTITTTTKEALSG